MAIYVNSDKKLIKSGGRNAIKVSIDFLKNEMEKILLKSPDFNGNISKISEFLDVGNLPVSILLDSHSIMEKDLEKIEFDMENSTSVPNEFVDDGGLLVGFHTLDNGLSFLGCLAGGDWELPVFFIIYHNGKSLRAYIPTCGNLINRDAKSAFGNYDDDEFMKKELGDEYYESSFEDAEYNWDLIEEDIKNRIIIL